MTERVYLPLQGPGGARPKAPSAAGWQSPTFESVDPAGEWTGLRTDGLVVIDCDSKEAAARWRKLANVGKDVYVRKSPRGFHFYYAQAADSPDGPHVDVLGGSSGIDIRAGRTAQVVFNAPGYRDIQGSLDQVHAPFNPSWVPAKRQLSDDVEEWSEMPDGRGNNTMTAIAGAMRRQGMSMELIYASLKGINKLSMTRDPMDDDMIRSIAYSVSRYEPDPDIDIIAEDDDEAVALALASDERVDQSTKRWMNAKLMTLPPKPDWLWKPYLPKHRLVMLDGQEGIGKGMFCVWAAVNVASGRPFPGDTASSAHSPQPVLWLSAEDDPHEDILRRLLAAGYDTAAHAPIYFLNPFDDSKPQPRFPLNIGELKTLLPVVKPALVILDPGRSYLAPENPAAEMSYNNEAALRPGLEALMKLAHQQQTTVVFVHHWNKQSQGTTRDKMGGSVSFLQAVRHRVALAHVGDQSALSVEKSNIEDTQFTVRSFEVVAKDDTAVFEIGGALTSYRDLDEWIDTMNKLAQESAPEIQVEIDWEEVAWHYSYLSPNAERLDLAPTAENFAKDLDLSLDEARKIRAQLREKGVIDKSGHWYGQTATARKRQVDDIGDDGESGVVRD